MNCIIALIGFMGAFDLCCTLKWIGANPYMEANPFMLWLWLISPILFILFKVTTTMLFCFIAFKTKDNKLLRQLIWLPFLVYLIIMIMHCFLI